MRIRSRAVLFNSLCFYRYQVKEDPVRRLLLLGGEDSSVNTLVAIANVVGANDLANYLPAKTAVAMEIVKQKIESEFHPNSPHCSSDCAARKAFQEDIALIRSMYDERIAEHKQVIAEKNKRIDRFRTVSFVLLGLFALAIAFAFYLIFIDFANPTWGIFQYPVGYWHEAVPQAFGL